MELETELQLDQNWRENLNHHQLYLGITCSGQIRKTAKPPHLPAVIAVSMFVCFWSTKKKICIKVKVSQRPTLTVLSSHFQIPFLLLCSFIFSSSISFYLLFSLLQTLGAGIKQRHMQRQHFILCRWINRLQLPKFLLLLYHCLRQWHNKPLCGVEDTWSAAEVQKCLEKKI